MALHFPGYVPLVENVVYGKDVIVGGTSAQGDVMKGIISLRQFQQVTEDQVYHYLCQKADEADGRARLLPPGTQLPLRDKSPLENALIAMDLEVRSELIAGSAELEQYVRARIPAINPKPGEASLVFVQVDYGLLPQRLLDLNQEHIERDKGEFYRVVLGNQQLCEAGLGKKFTVVLELQDSCLPSKEKIFPFLQQGVWGMPLLQVSPERYDRQEVEALVQSFYETVPSATEVALLEDTTSIDMESIARGVAVEHLVDLTKTSGSGIKIAKVLPRKDHKRLVH